MSKKDLVLEKNKDQNKHTKKTNKNMCFLNMCLQRPKQKRWFLPPAASAPPKKLEKSYCFSMFFMIIYLSQRSPAQETLRQKNDHHDDHHDDHHHDDCFSFLLVMSMVAMRDVEPLTGAQSIMFRADAF